MRFVTQIGVTAIMPGIGPIAQANRFASGESSLTILVIQTFSTGHPSLKTGKFPPSSTNLFKSLPIIRKEGHHTKKCAKLTCHNQENLFQITQQKATTTITMKLTQWTSTTNSKCLVNHCKWSTDSSETSPLQIIEWWEQETVKPSIASTHATTTDPATGVLKLLSKLRVSAYLSATNA